MPRDAGVSSGAIVGGRMLQIGLGAILVIAPIVLWIWGAQFGTVFALIAGFIGARGAAVLSLLGLLLLVRGFYWRAIRRRQTSDTPAEGLRLRSIGAMVWTSVACLVLMLIAPLYAIPLNALSLSGLPFGYFLVGIGLPLLFVVMVFLASWTQDRISREGRVHE